MTSIAAARACLVLPTLVSLLGTLVAEAGGQTHSSDTHPSSEQAPVSLLEGLGTHGFPISTDEPDAQAYFDQGLRLYYAFNHEEAIRSFREAQRLDPGCAMCWWGESLSWGPNINLPMEPESGVHAFVALQGALARMDQSTATERMLIEALSRRYEPAPGPERAHLDSAWAAALESAAREYPDNAEVSVLFAESRMTLRPWDYWTADARPAGGIEEALGQLEAVLATNPDHPGACHFYIHAVEQEYPERAVACAERLAIQMPAAGHLVHMPGHIYIRVGRYRDAIDANLHAVHADESYIRDQRPGAGMYTMGYYPHNYDFLAFAAAMLGREEQAIASADKVAELIPAEMFGVPGMAFLQHWATRPLQFRVRFGRWEEIIDTPAPSPELAHATAMWRYARGRARIAKGDLAGAVEELGHLRRVAASPELSGLAMEFNTSTELLGIAEGVLAAWIAAEQGDFASAVQHMETAVHIEDNLLYGEPPEWSIPVRQELGRIFLSAGRPAEAERAFIEDLQRFPANGWSLSGLAEALRTQGLESAAERLEAQLREVWEGVAPS